MCQSVILHLHPAFIFHSSVLQKADTCIIIGFLSGFQLSAANGRYHQDLRGRGSGKRGLSSLLFPCFIPKVGQQPYPTPVASVGQNIPVVNLICSSYSISSLCHFWPGPITASCHQESLGAFEICVPSTFSVPL